MKRLLIFIGFNIIATITFASVSNFWDSYKSEDYKKASELGIVLSEGNFDYLFLSAICDHNIYDYQSFHEKSDYYKYVSNGNYSSLKDLLIGVYDSGSYVINNLIGMVKVFLPEIQLDDAQNYFFRSLEINARNPVALNYLSMISIQQGQVAEGLSFAKQSIEENPAYPEPYNNLAFGCFQENELQEAIDILIECMKMCPLNTNSTYVNFIQLACEEVVLLVGDELIGVPGYKKDVDRTKLFDELEGNNKTLLELANQFFERNSYKEVELILNHVTPSPEIQGAYYLLKSMNAHIAKDSCAYQNSVDQLVKLKEADFLMNIGNSHFHNQDFENALPIYMEALEVAEDENTKMKILSNTGTVHLNLGNYDQAIEFFLLVLEISETDDITLTNIGIAYSLKGNQDQAREYLMKAKEHCKSTQQLQAIDYWLQKI